VCLIAARVLVRATGKSRNAWFWMKLPACRQEYRRRSRPNRLP
jgi:hypothetical protein